MNIEYFGEISSPNAIVIRSNYESEGIEFFSPLEFPQQLGYMKRPAGYEVAPHRHNQIDRKIEKTQEVLIIRSGECVVTLFNDLNMPTDIIELYSGDVILLAQGGHGIKMKTECQIIEVKQGPYLAELDKAAIEKSSN